MSRSIQIIHASEIIREGLLNIFRKHFSNGISGHRSLETVTFESGGMVVLAIKETLEEIFLADKASDKTNVVYVEFLNASSLQAHPRAKASVSLYDQEKKIVETLAPFLDEKDSDSSYTSGEELTKREIDVLRLVALGHPNKEIAEKLFISIHTVMTHRKNITEKLGIKSISGLTVYAMINKLILPDKSSINNLV